MAQFAALYAGTLQYAVQEKLLEQKDVKEYMDSFYEITHKSAILDEVSEQLEQDE